MPRSQERFEGRPGAAILSGSKETRIHTRALLGHSTDTTNHLPELITGAHIKATLNLIALKYGNYVVK